MSIDKLMVMKRRPCIRCGKPARSEEGCQICGHPFNLSCDACRKRFVNPDLHDCRIEAPLPSAAPEEPYPMRLDGPPPDLSGDRYRVREIRFLQDGTVIAVFRGTGSEVVLGSVWKEAAWALVEKGLIDPDTVVTVPGGHLWMTARALLEELPKRDLRPARVLPG